MNDEIENKFSQVITKLDNLLDEKNGLKISGNGILCENTKKINEALDKIQKFMFFMEARQNKMLKVLGKIANMSSEEIEALEKQKY
jgi:hypothetical protein